MDIAARKKQVGGVTYTLKEVSEGDLHLEYNCFNNCVYEVENSNERFCFGPGNQPPKCIEASEHFSSFKSHAIQTANETEKLINDKIKEYGSMKQFSTFKEKQAWMKKDIENITGKSWETMVAEHNTSLNNLTNIPTSKRIQLLRIERKIHHYVNNILDIHDLSENTDEVHEGLNKMEDDILHTIHPDPEVHFAAHHAIQSTRLALKLFEKDKDGKDTFEKINAAIYNNTDTSPTRARKCEDECKEEIKKGVVGSVIASAVGGSIGGAAAGCSVAGPVGCVVGFVGGAVGGAFIGLLIGAAGAGIVAIKHSCIATTSIVETTLGFKQISDLKIGDSVKTLSGGNNVHFTEFLGWMDRHQSQPAQMLRIWTSKGHSPLTLSASHVVFTSNTTKYAGDLQPGDCVIYWNGTAMEEMEVEAILPTISFGFWSPLTRAGHLLVDGFLTSCYASFPHQLADVAMAPVKAMSNILLDDHESQEDDGVRNVIRFIKTIGKFIGARKEEDISKQSFGNNWSFNNFFQIKSEL